MMRFSVVGSLVGLIFGAALTVTACDKASGKASGAASAASTGSAATAGANTGNAPGAPAAQGAAASAAGPLVLKTSTSYLYMGASDSEFSTSVELKDGGRLATKSKIDGVDAAGHRMTFEVTAIERHDRGTGDKTKVAALNKGEEGMIDLRLVSGTMRDFGGDFFLVDAGAPFPAEAGKQANADAAAREAARGTVEVILDGAAWPAKLAASGSAFYKNGLKMMNGAKGPYFVLAFVSAKAPDDRQLMLVIDGVAPTVGKVPATNIEVNFTGSPTGDPNKPVMLGYKTHPEFAAAHFNLNISRWEAKSPTEVVMDATFDAKLTGVISTKQTAVTMTGGVLRGVRVEVHERSE